jgi:peptide/nickel transport system substrate-binding protein
VVIPVVSDRVKRAAGGVAAGAVGLTMSVIGVTAPQAAASSADDPVVFHVGLRNEVDSFSPFLGIEATSFEMWALMYDQLITYSPEDISPQPGLASDWTPSDDGLTWTFTIRDDVTWSDGEKFTADDVAFTLNRILDGGPEAATWGSYLTSVDTITAPNDTTVVLKLSKPNAALPLLPIPIVPEHIWSDISEEEVKSYDNEDEVVGTGPFRYVEGTAGGSTYRFEVNPDYWGEQPKIDEIVYTVYQADDPMVQALKTGEIDFAEDVPALQLEALEGEDGIETVLGSSPGFEEIAFNTGSVDLDTGEPIGDPNPAVLDPAFRYALGFAIDRDLLVERAYQGAGEAGDTIIPPAYSSYHYDPPEDLAWSYDPDRAAELLDEAGYTMGDDGLRTMPDGSPIGTLRLIARSESEESVTTMDYFQEWLADLGIESEVTSMESGKLTNVILDGEFDAFEWGWYVEPDPTSMLSYMTCGQRGSWSDSWYCNEEYDRLYEQQASETDEEARTDMVLDMQEMLYRDAPYLVYVYDKIGEAYRCDRFEGFVPQPDPGGILIFQYGVRSYLEMYPVSECGQGQGGDEASADDGGGLGTGAVVGVGVATLAAVGAVAGILLHRRSTADERE